jgi:hypothetical protein
VPDVFRNVTVLAALSDHEPVNVAILTTGGSIGAIRYHAVPSFATAQVIVAVDAVNSVNKFTALTVFGVAVTPRKVTVLSVLIAHVPVNVQIRKTFAAGVPASPSITVGMRITGPPKANESTFSIVLRSFCRAVSPIR